jgi:hypothetical protein
MELRLTFGLPLGQPEKMPHLPLHSFKGGLQTHLVGLSDGDGVYPSLQSNPHG